MIPFARAALVSVFLAGLIAAPAVARSEATLTGVVRDETDAPVAGVVLTATDALEGLTRTATTGADGSYALALPPGTYSVKAALSGYWGPTQTVEVVAGGDAAMDFVLTLRPTEVVTVTATKREETPLEVPFSVVARTAEDLRDRGAEDIEDVAANIAGVTVQNLGPGQSQVAMRGVSAGQIARDQPGVKEQVGIYLDESPVSLSLFTPDLDLVDVARVEALRGPQGTLYGAGSVTGTLRYVTNAPVLGSDAGFVQAGAGVVDGGSAVGELKGGINLPLGEEVAARVVGYYSRTAGYTDAIRPDGSVDEDVEEGFRTGARVAVTFAPRDALKITPRVVYQRSEADGWNLNDVYNILANPFTTSRPAVTIGERQEFTQFDESFEDDFLLGDLDVRYDFGNLELTSITTYMDRKIRVVRDTTALSASFTGGSGGFPEPIYTLDSPLFDRTDATLWSEELRLAGERERIQWLAGVFFSRAERDYGQDVKILGFQDATGIPTDIGLLAPKDSIYFSDLRYDQDQLAVFGEATWSLSARFDLTGGLRYYDYSEDKDAVVDGVFGNPGYPATLLMQPGTADADGVAPRVIATYDLSDRSALNAQVAKGFRLGGINDPINLPLCSDEDLVTFGNRPTWDEETVWNYELGYKAQGLGGNTTLGVSAFYLDISDLQTTVTAGTCSSRLVFNVPEARSQGLELELATAPLRGLDVSLSASYTDAELRSTLTSTDAMGNVSVVSGIVAGRRLPSVPELQAALSASYRFALGSSLQGSVVGTWQHVGSRFTQVGDEDLGVLNMLDPTLPNTIGGPLTQTTFTYEPELPAYDLLNLRFGVQRGPWDIALYVNNVTDELAYLSLDRERGTLARIGYLTNQPRTFGIQTRFDF